MMTVIRIGRDRTINFILKDELQGMLSLGAATVKRASHVEPEPLPIEQMKEHAPSGIQWCADLSPIGGPKLTGFDNRAAALAAEVEWLQTNGVPSVKCD